MRTQNIAMFAWTAVAAAAALWTGVFMYAAWISAERDAGMSQAADAQSVSEREIANIRLHALVRDTENLRTQLEGLARADVIGIANTIDSIGKIAGVTLKIGAATPESTVQKRGTVNTSVLHAVGFVIEADGTFPSLMHAAALLESLPTLSSVQGMEFEHTPLSGSSASAKSAPWHLTARIRVLTAVDI